MPFRRGNSRVTADYSPGRGTRLRLVTGCVKASGEQLQGSLTPRRSILWASFFFLNGFKFFVFPSLLLGTGSASTPRTHRAHGATVGHVPSTRGFSKAPKPQLPAAQHLPCSGGKGKAAAFPKEGRTDVV